MNSLLQKILYRILHINSSNIRTRSDIMPKIRVGEKPEWVKDETDVSILRALHEARESGGLRFTHLWEKTKLSKDTLYRHLRDLFAKGWINYNYLTKCYSISQNGLNKLETSRIKEKIRYGHNLSSPNDLAGFVSMGEMLIAIQGFLASFIKAARSAGLLRENIGKEDFDRLRQCVQLTVYSDNPLREANYKRIKEGLHMARELIFIFSFDTDKLSWFESLNAKNK